MTEPLMMTFDPELYWSTHAELFMETFDPDLATSICKFLVRMPLCGGIFVISSADAFKKVNDELGRETGDAVLRNIWNNLSTGKTVKFAARCGGDSLLFVFDADVADLPELAKKHLAPVKASDTLSVGRSLGCAVLPQNAVSESQLQAVWTAVDLAHLHAKKRGGNMAIRCLNFDHADEDEDFDWHKEFYWQAKNFEVVFAGEPSRRVYEPRDGSKCR